MSLECKRVWISVARKELGKLKNSCVNWTIDEEIPINSKATFFVPWAHHTNSIKTNMKKNLLCNSENLFSNTPFKKKLQSVLAKNRLHNTMHIFAKNAEGKNEPCCFIGHDPNHFSSVCIFSYTFSSGLYLKRKLIWQNKFVI